MCSRSSCSLGRAGRAGLIRRAIGAGKHVLTTKPFELDPWAAREVLAEAQRLGRWFSSIHRHRWYPRRSPRSRSGGTPWTSAGRPVGAAGGVWAAYQETPE
jgi:hypothetical protein